ncbi:MAG: LptF/LptG family permease [Pseudomonadota bacterium]
MLKPDGQMTVGLFLGNIDQYDCARSGVISVYLIQRYIWKRTAARTLLIFMIISVVITTTQLLNFVDSITHANDILYISSSLFVLLLPTTLVVVLPVAYLVAYLQIHTTMDQDHEITTLNMMGLKPVSVIFPSLTLATLLSITVLLISVFIEPAANRKVIEIIGSLRSDAISSVFSRSELRKLDDGLYVRAGSEDDAGILKDIFILDRREPGIENVYFSKLGTVFTTESSVALILSDGTNYHRNDETGDFHSVDFDTFVADLGDFFPQPGKISFKPRHKSTLELLAPYFVLNSHTGNLIKEGQELARRFSDWLYPLVFLFIGKFVLMHQNRERRSRYWSLPIVIGCCVLAKIVGIIMLGMGSSHSIAQLMALLIPFAIISVLGPVVISR